MRRSLAVLAITCSMAMPALAAPATENAFSPRQGAMALVVKTIQEAQHSIRVAAYSFTSEPIAEALVDAADNGIDVEIIMDKSQRKARHTELHYLRWHGVPTRINSHYAIMHNKFMIIDGAVLELGSFNYTKSAEEKNAENVLVIRDNPALIHNYQVQWDKLWAESD